jgi:glycosyltransferase involved in cell wall biosynthesis
MNILVISPMLPYPVDNGGANRLHNLYRRIAKKHTITWVCPVWEGQEDNIWGVEAFSDRVVQLPRGEERAFKEHGWAGLLLKVVAHLHWERLFVFCFGYVDAPGLYWLPATTERLETVTRVLSEKKYDIVVTEFEGNAELVQAVKGIPCVLATHNVASSIFKRIRSTHPGSWEDRLFRKPELLKILRYEKRNYAAYQGAVAVSEGDRRVLQQRCRQLPVEIIQNGVDIEYYRPGTAPEDEHGMVYIGNYGYPPNADAMIYFCREIFPLIRRSVPDAHLTLLGANPPRELSGMPGVKLAGFIEDIRPIVQAAGMMVVPLRMGGGTRLKILDGMAMGKAIVSTHIGAEGLDVHPDEDILVANEPADFAAQVIRLMEDSNLRHRLGANGRKLVERDYNWDRLAEREADWFERIVEYYQHPHGLEETLASR